MGSFFKPKKKGRPGWIRINNIKASALGTPDEISRIRRVMDEFQGTIVGVYKRKGCST